MKIKIKANNYYKDKFFVGEIYEVILMLNYNWTKHEEDENKYSIVFYFINRHYEIDSCYGNEVAIIDSALDSDFILTSAFFPKNQQPHKDGTTAFALYPESISLDKFLWAIDMSETLELDQVICKRFKHLLPEYKYAEYFKENYQDPNLNITAESIGNSWVLCPECNEAFEVDMEQGVITCPNVACKVQMNSPYRPAPPLAPAKSI